MRNLLLRHLQNFYATSPMRNGVLNWYPFAADDSVLEHSNGALTQLLHTKCGKVVSFDDAYGENDTFDYVVCIDPKDITVERLARYRSHLHAHGRLLLSFENAFGLQYFAGKRNKRTELPFDFWAGESKREVEHRIAQAGFAAQKWYYPFTNHYFCREMYSENHLPNEFLNNRGYIFLEDDYSKEFDERTLWREVIRNGAFAFMCNSYLVEARMCAADRECTVDYAAITAYREKDKAFITTLHNDGHAQKQPVYTEGVPRLEKMRDNHAEIAALGVNVLPVEWNGGALTMKRLDLPTLWDYWTQRLAENTLDIAELLKQYDRIREAIYRSSKNGKVFWELVPANCFYDVDKDDLLFFDQEYYWTDVEPDVALVRAIHTLNYSWDFIRNPETSRWIEQLKQRYGLADRWDALSAAADSQTIEYVFNGANTAPLERAINRTVERMHERFAERVAQRATDLDRYQKICVAIVAMAALGIKRPIIYGYGQRGKMLRHILEISDIDVACIIDKGNPVVRGVELVEDIGAVPAELEYDAIIVTPRAGANKIAAKIAGTLKLQADCYVLTLEELMF